MGKLRKMLDKGIAYQKKNGFRALLARGWTKARQGRNPDYGEWLRQNRLDAAALEELRARHGAMIRRIRVVERVPDAVREDLYYLFVTEGGKLEDAALALFAQAAETHPQAQMFYCDSDCFDREGRVGSPCFKPELDRYLLYSLNYIGGGFLVSGKLLQRIGPCPAYGEGEAALYGLLLACAQEAEEAVHIPQILYHGAPREMEPGLHSFLWNVPADLRAAEAEKKTLEVHFAGHGIRAEVLDGERPGVRRIRFLHAEKPLVSVLIPNRDYVPGLSRCLQSIERLAGYENLEILILENNSAEEETFAFYERIAARGNVRVLRWEGDFDYARINNFGAEYAAGEYLLFLNNDTEMRSEGCVSELLGYAMCADVGAVGARLCYPDGSIQHAGVILGYGGVAGHAFEGLGREKQRLVPWIAAARQYSAVTAACMMVRKDLFLSLGGFCRELKVAYNDVDLCLRIRARGKKVIYDPYAVLLHDESQTRGMELTREKAERVRREADVFCGRWRELLQAGDPCYNRNLTLDKADFSCRRTERAAGVGRKRG